MLTVGRARLRMAQLDKAISIAQDAFAMLKKIPTTTSRLCEDKVHRAQWDGGDAVGWQVFGDWK